MPWFKYYKCCSGTWDMYLQWTLTTLMVICCLLQVRNFNRYHVKHRRQHEAAQTYLNSDVCADAITRAQLGTFNLCEKAEQIVNEQPSQTAFYEILNDWYPCGHGRCEGGLDWFWSKIHWFVLGLGGFGLLFYFKWVEHQRDMMFTKMSLPLLRAKIEHVD